VGTGEEKRCNSRVGPKGGTKRADLVAVSEKKKLPQDQRGRGEGKHVPKGRATLYGEKEVQTRAHFLTFKGFESAQQSHLPQRKYGQKKKGPTPQSKLRGKNKRASCTSFGVRRGRDFGNQEERGSARRDTRKRGEGGGK